MKGRVQNPPFRPGIQLVPAKGTPAMAAVIEDELELAQTFGTTHALASVTGSSVPAPDLQ